MAEGSALQAEGKHDEAVVALRAAVKAEPRMSNAWFSLGYAEYLKAGGKSSEEEIEAHEHCIALDPKNRDAHICLGLALQNVRKDYDGAVRMYEKTIELDKDFPNAHYNLSKILEQQYDNLTGAVGEMEEFVRCGGIPGFSFEDGMQRLEELKTKLEAKKLRYAQKHGRCPGDIPNQRTESSGSRS